MTARTVSGKLTAVAPSADGRFVYGVHDRQLVRYRTKPTKIRETGRSKTTSKLRHIHSGELDLAVHPSGRFVYVAIQPWKRTQKYAVLIFRVDRPKPRLVKTIRLNKTYPDSRVKVWSMALRPDGKRLYLHARTDLLTFAMKRGAAGELVSVHRKAVGFPEMAVTPDGTKLLTGVNKGDSTRFLRYRVWDITGNRPVAGPERRVDLAAYDFEEPVSLSTIVPAPDNSTAYVQGSSWGEDYADIPVARIGLADGTIRSTLGNPFGAYRFEELLGVSPSGHRTFGLNRGPGGSDSDERDPFLARANRTLGDFQRLRRERFALEDAFAVSPAGRTKGLIYSTQRKNGKRYLVSIRG